MSSPYSPWRLLCVFLLLASLAFVIPVPTTRAASCTVTTDADSGVGSLRDKIGDPSCSTIVFAGDYLIRLQSTLTIDRSMTIDGTGHAVTVDGDSDGNGSGDVRVFYVNAGLTVTLKNLTVSYGYVLDTVGGGGLANAGSVVNIVNGTFANHYAVTWNGQDGGGAVYSAGGTLNIVNTTFADNQTQNMDGGSLFIGSGATAYVANSTFTGNTAASCGGAISVSDGGALYLTNSTLTGNTANPYYGGAIMNWGSALTVVNSTIAGNSAAAGGGGIASVSTTYLYNTIMANNGNGNCAFGTFVDGGGNLRWPSYDTSCVGPFGDPNLGPLGDHGGATFTMPLLAGSAAINAAVDATCPATDQRGYGRNGTCDVGAYEYYIGSPVPPDLTATKTNDAGAGAWPGQLFNWTVTITNMSDVGLWFAVPETILRDDLPATGAVYGAPTVANAVGVVGSDNIACAIDADNTLECVAGGTVTFAAGGHLDVIVPTTSDESTGLLQNPRAGGVCRVDPDGAILESNETNNDCSDDVLVAGPPTAGLISNSPVYLGQTMSFTDTSSGFPPIDSWAWSFAGGIPGGYSGQTPPPVTFTEAGTHTVTLEVHNAYTGTGGGIDTYITAVTVCSAPLNGAAFTPQWAVAGQVTTFTAVLTPSDVIPLPVVEWSFGATGFQVQYTFPDPGQYPVVITATNACDRVVYSGTVEVVPPTYTLAIGTVGLGSVVLDPDQPSYLAGDVVTLTAVPDPGWSFAGWSGDAGGTENPLVIAIQGDTAITATFSQDEYTLTVTVSGQGTVGVEPQQPTYLYGDVVTLTAVPDTGWSWASWSGDAGGTDNPLVITIQGDTAITATFSQDEYVYRVYLPIVFKGYAGSRR